MSIPTDQLLAEYMEKFGKKLNEQESRTGDELFMWLKDKLTTEAPAPQRELPVDVSKMTQEERRKHYSFVTTNGTETEWEKGYQSGVEAERKQHNWWGNFDNYHAHCINGEHVIGKNPGYGCDECKRVFGTGYTDTLTNQRKSL